MCQLSNIESIAVLFDISRREIAGVVYKSNKHDSSNSGN
jgi:hypothetical protein